MNTAHFTNTSSHMVQEVKNIIDGYKMGSMRALAQEPVQNALDAVRKGSKLVEVEYRLLRRTTQSGERCSLLTVADSGTTGLRGPMVTADELEARNYLLKSDENWAAFEAQGYSKENEEALGSRGQGKSAFLFHSHVPGATRRMLMLYDTRLEDGEYRLGMRFARPVDQILSPPLFDKEARDAMRRDYYQLGDLAVPLGLKPLPYVGTRIIVPYLSDEVTSQSAPGGELSRWLQRCWWRAIQTGRLRIRVVNDATGEEETIEPPRWWRDLPRDNQPSASGNWFGLPDGGRACAWSDVDFGDGQRIRRLVLLHSDELEADEIVKDEPEYAGIQILRGAQWIETRGARQDYGDQIPRDKRPGFRGYVEFDRHTDGFLRETENSQHDGFYAVGKKGKTVRDLRAELQARILEFSNEMDWESPSAITTQQVSRREKDTHLRFLETFVNPNGRKPKPGQGTGESDGKQFMWECRLKLSYPDPGKARVDWGQTIRSVYVEVGCKPGDALVGSADLVLEWVDETGNALTLVRKEAAISNSWGEERTQAQIELGNWQVHRGNAKRDRTINCPVSGEYRLRAVVEYRGDRAASAARTVYVQEEPPAPPEHNPVTLSINITNCDDGEKNRIDHAEVVQIDIFSRNRLPDSLPFSLVASADFENEAYARHLPIDLKGTPVGEIPPKRAILTLKRQLLDPQQPTPLKLDDIPQVTMPESSGRFYVRAELLAGGAYEPKPVSKPVYFQRDPGNAVNRLPFGIEKVDHQKEIWKLNDDLDKLTYSGNYPLYKEMKEMRRLRYALQGRQAFIAEICANGLLEWAFRRKENGDDSNYDQLYDESRGLKDSRWDTFNRLLESLSKSESSIHFAQIWREAVSVMLDIFAEESS